MVNVPLEQLPLLFKVVLHSCKTSAVKEWPVPSTASGASSALGGQDRLQRKEPERPRWRLWSSCLHHKNLFVCLSVFNLIFLYIYFTTELNVWPSTWCTCFCVNAADAFPCSLQNVKMFNVTVLSLFRDSSFVFWGRGWDGVDDYSHNVDKDNYLNGNRDMTIPTFPQFLSRHMLVCSRTGCLFIAPEKYAKGAKQYRETY